MSKKVQKRKKVPMRTCIGCGETRPKRELLRIVRTPGREIVIDKSGKMNGRGTYLCFRRDCVEIAINKNKIDYALDVILSKDQLECLQRDITQVIEDMIEVS